MFQLEQEITHWKDQLQLRNALPEDALQELEAHLRDEIEQLIESGLTEEEALIIGIKRLGNTHALAREFSAEFGENIWRQLVIEPDAKDGKTDSLRRWFWIAWLVLCGGTLFHLVVRLGRLSFESDELFKMALLNLGLFVLPSIFVFFAARREVLRWFWIIGLGGFAISAILVNLYPYAKPEHTRILTGIHLPIFLWLLCEVAYCGREWRTSEHRMGFIRATGEIFIYTVLILCGLGVFQAFVGFVFFIVGVDVQEFLFKYVMIYGSFAAPALASYLVIAKRSVVENFAPILARIFSPLFLIMIAGFLVVIIVTGKSISAEREYLIGFDLMLAFVIGMVVYSISARDPHERIGIHDILLWLLVFVTIVADLYALSGILARLASYGFSANRTAALGENLILLGNLSILFWCLMQYIRGRLCFEIIELWQTRYLWVYFVWAGIVAFLFPGLFGFK